MTTVGWAVAIAVVGTVDGLCTLREVGDSGCSGSGVVAGTVDGLCALREVGDDSGCCSGSGGEPSGGRGGKTFAGQVLTFVMTGSPAISSSLSESKPSMKVFFTLMLSVSSRPSSCIPEFRNSVGMGMGIGTN
jgi:hypothetical protein